VAEKKFPRNEVGNKAVNILNNDIDRKIWSITAIPNDKNDIW
jgi:hypothetical protein